MDIAELIFDCEGNVWKGNDGEQFIRNEFNPTKPVLIAIEEEKWSATYAGVAYRIAWGESKLPACIQDPIKDLLKIRFTKLAPSTMSTLNWLFRDLAKACDSNGIDTSNGFGSISASSWRQIWGKLNSNQRTHMREIYSQLAERRMGGASVHISLEMKRWKARSEIINLRYVLEWDATKGALTTAETEVLRNEVRTIPDHETVLDTVARLFTWTSLETLKRPIQLLSMEQDALIKLTVGTGKEDINYFLNIPPAKAQSGKLRELWPVSRELGKELDKMMENAVISEQQRKMGRYFVLPQKDGKVKVADERNQVSTASMGFLIQDWSKKRGILSPRTKKNLHLRPKRLRHTGATAMANQGVPRQVIQDILEQDSPASADAYIKSVGSDLFPAIERASDRGLGRVFDELSDSFFFKGAIGCDQGGRKVVIPIVLETPKLAIVGNCSSTGQCHRHPFWSCYDGCPNFIAWQEFDHGASLSFVEQELHRWGDAEGNKDRSKLLKDFERTAAAIRNVISQIEALNNE